MPGLIKKEPKDLWQNLQKAVKPVVLYGMGNGAEKIMAALEQYKINLAAVFASDEFVRGHSFKGYRVLKYSEVAEAYPDFIVLVAFGTERPDVIAKIESIAAQKELYVPDVPVIGCGLWNAEYYRSHLNEINEAYALLADPESKTVFQNLINFKLSGKLGYLQGSVSKQAKVYQEIFKLNANEIYLDLGAYNGDTVAEFIELTQGQYEKIMAWEPDKKNFAKLLKRIEDNNYTKVEGLNLGAWHEQAVLAFHNSAGRNSSLSRNQGKPVPVNSVDQVLAGAPVTYIKMDVEGAEKKALSGAAQTLKRFRPKLLVSAYHRNEDLFSLPVLIHELNPDYQIYLRRHPAIPAWNINIYAK